VDDADGDGDAAGGLALDAQPATVSATVASTISWLRAQSTFTMIPPGSFVGSTSAAMYAAAIGAAAKRGDEIVARLTAARRTEPIGIDVYPD
jgi:hypothetical protein